MPSRSAGFAADIIITSRFAPSAFSRRSLRSSSPSPPTSASRRRRRSRTPISPPAASALCSTPPLTSRSGFSRRGFGSPTYIAEPASRAGLARAKKSLSTATPMSAIGYRPPHPRSQAAGVRDLRENADKKPPRAASLLTPPPAQ